MCIDGVYSFIHFTYRFLAEETNGSEERLEFTDAPIWIIDPIDGTINFVLGLLLSAISVALLINKLPEIRIIYNPMLK